MDIFLHCTLSIYCMSPVCVCVRVCAAASGSAGSDRPCIVSAQPTPHVPQTESSPPGLFLFLHLLLFLGSQRGAAGQQ